MTDPEIKQFVEQCRDIEGKATKGPWERYNLIGDAGGLRRVAAIKLDPPPLPGKSPERKQVAVASLRSDDAAFIAHARNTYQKLLGIIERLMVERDRYREALEIAEQFVVGLEPASTSVCGCNKCQVERVLTAALKGTP